MFKSYVFTVLGLLLLFFLGSLAHTIRGVNYKFTIILNLAVIQSIICYIIYTALYLNGGHWKFPYFLALLSFELYHWLLAMRYFKSSR